MKWTSGQQKVIDLRNRNILVSAAAGSGKTAVLVERIIQMITNGEHPMDIDRLLIVTFTNLAAAEMRERIGAAIEKKIEEEPDNAHLQKQMTLIHSAQITTIHSFCKNVISNHFNLIDLDPSFRMGDEAELKLLQSDVLEDLLEEEYEKEEDDFLELVESYSGGKNDSKLEELILQLYKFSMSYPWPEEWLTQKGNTFDMENIEELNQGDFMRNLLDYVKSILGDLLIKNKESIELCEEFDGPQAYTPAFLDDKDLLERLNSFETYEEYMSVLGDTISYTALSRKRMPDIDEEKKSIVQKNRDEMKKVLKSLQKDFFFQPLEEMLSDIHGVRKSMKALIRLTIEFSERYRKEKEEKVLLDFNDLEHLALKVLVKKEGNEVVPTQAAMDYSEQYEEILIDEYQDSNYVQETILNSISKERKGMPNVFMVGDVKQSIYKFRLAKPELFMGKYETYTLEDSKYQRIDLHKNFRSRGVVLASINYIFEQIMTKKLGNIEYNEDAALYEGALFPDTEGNISETTELMLVIEDDGDLLETEKVETYGEATTEMEKENPEIKEEEVEYTKMELEAKAIAKRIKELVDQETGLLIYDGKKSTYRRAEYGDIVILLRNNKTEAYVDTFMSEGIPAYTSTKTGYFETLEIRTIINYLKIVDNPLQDIPLAAVLHSPMVGVSNDELAELRNFCKEKYLYDVIMQYVEEGESEELKSKLSIFIASFHEFRIQMDYLPIHELMIKILEATRYYDYITAMPAGNVRRANVDMLIQKAIAFESTSYHGLFHFIRYIDKLKKFDIDFGEASVSNDNENTVRIMTIHKSKGLEFPIVFLAGMANGFNQQDSKSKLVLHADLGIGPEFVDPIKRIKAPTLMKKVIQRTQVLENIGEELRVLYVALTRAKEKLIMTGYVDDLEKLIDKYQGLVGHKEKQLPFLQLAKANSYLYFVLSALIRNPEVYDALKNPQMKSLSGNSKFEVKILPTSELLNYEMSRQEFHHICEEDFLGWDPNITYNDELQKKIQEVLQYTYPYELETNLRGKVTVSELKRLRQKGEEEDSESILTQKVVDTQFEIPMENSLENLNGIEDLESKENLNSIEGLESTKSFIQQESVRGEPLELLREQIVPKFMSNEVEVTSAKLGTVYHRILQEINLNVTLSKDEIQKEIKRLVDEKKIPEEGLQKINTYWIRQFLKSPLADRMRKAGENEKLYKERQFVFGIKANEVKEEFQSDELMLVQGIIDVYFEEEGELVLVDYKTDRIKEGEEQILISRYEVQLNYYQRALEQILQKKVKEKVIYSFALQKEILV